jgi:carbonic anhydrase/acetyltransferase-like protein (isoleucine patch superfamily)
MTVPGTGLLRLGGLVPRPDPGSIVLPGATLVGDVRLGTGSSVWYGSVLRADDAAIVVGVDSNLQDGVIVHADPGYPTVIGDRVTVGHGAVIHGSRVDDDCLIGMRAVLLNGVRLGPGCLVAAGAVVPQDTEVPPGSLVMGVPGRVRRPVNDAERQMIADGWADYVEKARRHHGQVRPVSWRARWVLPGRRNRS